MTVPEGRQVVAIGRQPLGTRGTHQIHSPDRGGRNAIWICDENGDRFRSKETCAAVRTSRNVRMSASTTMALVRDAGYRSKDLSALRASRVVGVIRLPGPHGPGYFLTALRAWGGAAERWQEAARGRGPRLLPHVPPGPTKWKE